MKTFIYTKGRKRNVRKIMRFSGMVLSLAGVLLGLYMLFPLISWQIYLKPAFAEQSFAAPIPKQTIVTQVDLSSLVQNVQDSLSSIDYSNVQNWLPETYEATEITTDVSYYYLSIPKLEIHDAVVSTIDTDIGKHLVQYGGTATPPSTGNTAIFGHSTLPQLFNPRDYKTIFAKAHTLIVGDTLQVTVNNNDYTYRIQEITIVDSKETSFLAQPQEGSYLTIVTCTPPGTVWKRLIVKAKLENI
ncbi:MAG: sortase [Patescibacteria group bacterium]